LTTCEGSITRWIGELKSGGAGAVQLLWERYFDRLVRLARQRLRAGAGGAAEAEEDAALSAIDNFCRSAARGRFPWLADRHDVWRLLATITVRKALNQIERQCAKKRGGGRLVDEAGLLGADSSRAGAGLDGFAGRGLSHELDVLVAEEYRRLWARLGEDSLRMVLDLSLQGHTREEIANRMECSVTTVARKQDVIRTVWLAAEDRS
jgi:DNA-directed RNA polymerase specialized sigma24 family protein